ncbi:MAG: peptidase inhibitor family I36 protein [Rhizobiaceae bacterium]
MVSWRKFRIGWAAGPVLGLALTLGGISAAPTVAHAQWWKDHDGCLVTEHRDGKGKSWIVNAGESWSYVGGKWNDKISSVICEVYCHLQVWEHRDYRGATRVFDQTALYVGGAWNDKISSMRAWCDP